MKLKCKNLTYELEIFRHFLAVAAKSQLKESYMEWVRFIESKLRHLIANLEKNQYIKIAHINPQGYEQIKEIE